MVVAAMAATAALASAGAAVYGATQQSAAAKAANRNNAAQLSVQKRQMELSEDQQEASLAPTRNARGDVTRYVPGVGWIEEPSALTRTLMARSDQEEALRLAQDMPRQRMQREAMFAQQQQERGLANAMLARQGIGARSLADVEADAVRSGVASNVAGKRGLSNDAVIAALRQGSGAQHLLEAQGGRSQADTRSVLENARAGAPKVFADAESARLNDSQNRYAQMASRAYAPDNVAFTPNTLADTLTSGRMNQQRTAPYGLAMASNIRPAQFSPVQDMTAVGISSAAKAIEGLSNNPSVQKAGQWIDNKWDQWFSTPPQTASTARVATNQPQAYYSETAGVW